MESYDELSAKDMLKEIERLRRCSRAAKVTKEEPLGLIFLRFLEFFIEYELSNSIPNLTLVLKFFLALCVFVSSCERSFSNFKLKNYLRSTMNKVRLSNLGILSIENGVAKRRKILKTKYSKKL